MSRDLAYIWDMITAAKKSVEYARGKNADDLMEYQLHVDAIIRQLSVLGEAARRVTEDFKKEHPEIAWKEIIGLRNILIHEYDTVDIDTLWDLLNSDLPDMIEILERIISEDE